MTHKPISARGLSMLVYSVENDDPIRPPASLHALYSFFHAHIVAAFRAFFENKVSNQIRAASS